MTTRRGFLAGAAAVSAGLAGCSSGSSDDDVPDDADIVVGPGGNLSFDPSSLTVSTGETVTWYFDSGSHNVSCNPDHHANVSLPEGAEPFSSCPADSPYDIKAAGETYEHTFDTAGEYHYVCVPHATSMKGTITVE